MLEKKKILIVSAAFYPEDSPRSFRTTELAKEISRQGHEVTVFIPKRGKDYTLFETEHSLRIKNLGPLSWKQIDLKGGRIELLIRRVIRRALLMFFEWPNIELMCKVSKTLRKENGYDLLISIAFPYSIHWGVAKVRRNNHRIAKCWVADCGDPFMGDTTDSFRKLFYFKYLEKWFCRKADYISIPFDGAKSAYYSEFHPKIRVIPQGFRFEGLDLPKYKITRPFPVFAYAGTFNKGTRDPRPFLEYLSIYKSDFQFIIYTKKTDLIRPYMDKLGQKLKISDYIPREEVLKILSTMDFLINFDYNISTVLSSKLIDYALTGRPVLNITNPIDYKSIDEFLKGDYSHQMKLGKPDQYSIENVAKKFLDLQITY